MTAVAKDLTRGAVDALAGWRSLWDEVYGRSETPRDPALHLAGWTSSYTGLPIREAEMREWVERTVERLLDPTVPTPRRALEIGCGTGMFLLRVAQVAEQVVGLDFSAEVLAFVRRRVESEGLAHVALHQKRADEVDQVPDVAPRSLDLVVLNSVAQYFPTVEYFEDVVGKAANLLAPGGRLFLGDLRSRPLLEAFHLSVALQQADDTTSLAELAERVATAVRTERELTFDPAWIVGLAARLDRAPQVEIQLKRGRAKNELTRFRYDAVLRFDPNPEDPQEEPLRLAWGDPEATPAALRRRLGASGGPGGDAPRQVIVSEVPNARLVAEIEAVRRLAASREGDVASLRATLAATRPAGLEPEEMWALGTSTPYRVVVRGSSLHLDRFEVILTRRDSAV